MNLGRFTIKMVLITFTCFLLSYASSVLGNLNSEKSFPHSLFTQYTKTIGNTQTVEIEKNIESSEISQIEIQTTQTDVEIKADNVKQISVGLRGHYVSQTNHPDAALQVIPEGSKLLIKTGEADFNESSFFHMSNQETDGKMIVVVPANIKKIKIKTVSGDISVNSMQLENLTIESVSGDSLLSQTSSSALQFKSVSGGIAGTGKFSQVLAKSISGGAKLTFSNSDPNVEFKSTSGDFQAFFSKTPDLNLQFSTISGGFDLDPAFGTDTKENKRVQKILGNGAGKFSVNTISGDFKIGRVEKLDD